MKRQTGHELRDAEVVGSNPVASPLGRGTPEVFLEGLPEFFYVCLLYICFVCIYVSSEKHILHTGRFCCTRLLEGRLHGRLLHVFDTTKHRFMVSLNG